MNAKKFMDGLQSVIDQFEGRVKMYGVINEDGVQIDIAKNYAVLEAIVDDNDNTWSFSQEIEFSDEEITALYLHKILF